MTPCFINSKRKEAWFRPAQIAIASLATLIVASLLAGAAGNRNEGQEESIERVPPASQLWLS